MRLFSAKVMFWGWKETFQVANISCRVTLGALLWPGLSLVLSGVYFALCTCDGGEIPCPVAHQVTSGIHHEAKVPCGSSQLACVIRWVCMSGRQLSMSCLIRKAQPPPGNRLL